MAEQEEASGLPHHDELSRLYRQLDSVRPTAQTDRIILAAARKAIAPDHGGTLACLKRIGEWLLAPRHITVLASLAVIGFLGLMTIQRPLPQPEAISPAPLPAAQEEAPTADAAAPQRADSVQQEPVAPHGDVKQKQSNPALRSTTAAGKKQDINAPTPAPQAQSVPATAGMNSANTHDQAADRDVPISASSETDFYSRKAERSEAKLLAAPAPAKASESAEALLQRINKALEQDDRNAAHALYLQLKKQHPEFRIPPALAAEFADYETPKSDQ